MCFDPRLAAPARRRANRYHLRCGRHRRLRRAVVDRVRCRPPVGRGRQSGRRVGRPNHPGRAGSRYSLLRPPQSEFGAHPKGHRAGRPGYHRTNRRGSHVGYGVHPGGRRARGSIISYRHEDHGGRVLSGMDVALRVITAPNSAFAHIRDSDGAYFAWSVGIFVLASVLWSVSFASLDADLEYWETAALYVGTDHAVRHRLWGGDLPGRKAAGRKRHVEGRSSRLSFTPAFSPFLRLLCLRRWRFWQAASLRWRFWRMRTGGTLNPLRTGKTVGGGDG